MPLSAASPPDGSSPLRIVRWPAPGQTSGSTAMLEKHISSTVPSFQVM